MKSTADELQAQFNKKINRDIFWNKIQIFIGLTALILFLIFVSSPSAFYSSFIEPVVTYNKPIFQDSINHKNIWYNYPVRWFTYVDSLGNKKYHTADTLSFFLSKTQHFVKIQPTRYSEWSAWIEKNDLMPDLSTAKLYKLHNKPISVISIDSTTIDENQQRIMNQPF